mgnify:CR=1 FL=1
MPGSRPSTHSSDQVCNTILLLSSQLAVRSQAVSSAAQTLKYYFAVDTNYVAKKIGLILCPFLHKVTGPFSFTLIPFV